MLWRDREKFLRPQDSKSTGFVLRPEADLSGSGNPEGLVCKVREGETGETGLAFGKPFLHEAVCFLGGAQVSVDDDPGCGEGNAAGLAYGQRDGKTVYAGAVETDRNSAAPHCRDRRDFDPQRAYVPDCGKRFGEETADLVWRPRPVGRESGRVLSMAGREKDGQDAPRRDGYVEGLRKVDEEERPGSCDSLRQVSCDPAFAGSPGQDPEAGICKIGRPGSELHQGPEVHPALASGKSDPGRPSESSEITPSQQAPSYGISSQGILRPALGLSDRRLGKPVLRTLEGCSEVAAPETLRGVYENDRKALGRDCCLLQPGEQNCIGIRGRTEQQNPGNSEESIRLERRGISSAQNPDLYASGNLK